MEIKVELFTGMHDFTPKDAKRGEAFKLTMPENCVVQDVIQKLKIPDDFVFKVLVNSQGAAREKQLKEQDSLSFFPFLV